MSTTALKKKSKDQAESVKPCPVFVPATDIYENEDGYLLRCDMPGVSQDQVDVTLEDGVLTVTGTQSEQKRDGYEEVYTEYPTGIYRRAFTIRQAVEETKITAKLSNGMLELTLPKAEIAKPRRIEIQT